MIPPGAAVMWRRRLAGHPGDDEAALRYASMALASGDGDATAIWLGASAAIRPSSPFLFAPMRALAHAYLSAGRPDLAKRTLRRAMVALPVDWEAWNDLGVLSDRLSDEGSAGRAFRAAIVLAPGAETALSNLADLLFRAGAYATAGQFARHAAGNPEALLTAGNSALRSGQPVVAARCFRRSLALAPDMLPSLVGRGVAAMADDDVATAGAWLKRAQSLDPNDVSLNNNLATWHLVQGDYPRGFAFYEWRWRRPEAQARRGGLPEWSGTPIAGRRILLYAEQGLGDVLQMVRYVPMLSRLGASVVIECPPFLHRLLESLPGSPRLVPAGEAAEADLQAPLMSLPRLLGTTVATIPADGPYLFPEAELIAATAAHLANPGRRIGLVWQGNPRQVDEPHRSIPLDLLAPLVALPGATVYGLQRDHGREQMEGFRGRDRLVDLGPKLDDLATTAAILAQLDLVITTCTAVAHLAGALGRPVWIMLKRGADWRWMLDRPDSPWYPTARLIRQRRPGDWQEVAERVTKMTRAWIG